MMQNKLEFHQSSVSLEIIGLPDYSNNEDKDQISIISQWKLNIIDKPLIEGKMDHLVPIMDAFYIYSNLLITNDIPLYESNLIDIKADNLHIHNIVLKSSKPDVEPLIIKIGNSLLSDIINCFDQLNESSKITMKKTSVFKKVHEGVQKCTFELLQDVTDKEECEFGRTETFSHQRLLAKSSKIEQ